jgi:hypothetical protein
MASFGTIFLKNSFEGFTLPSFFLSVTKLAFFSLSKFHFNLTLLQVLQIHSKDTSAKNLAAFTEACKN